MRIVLRSFLFLFFASFYINCGLCQSNKVTNFARDVAPLLRDNCLSCHEGDKASNGFVISDRDALLAFVEPGNSAASSLWTDYLAQPSKDELKESLVMPPGGPLKAQQLALLKLWIDEGADWPADAVIRQDSIAVSVANGNGLVSTSRRIYRAIGYFHPALVHFPIALFLVGGICAFLSYFLGAKCQTTSFQCVAVATSTSIITVAMGWSFADTQGYPAWDQALPADASHRDLNLFYHRWVGTFTALVGVACVFLALLARRNKSVRLNHVWRIIAMILAVLVSIVGHQGGEMVYGEVFDKAIEQLFR